ncbi:MAG: hypothetical protein ACK4F9_00465 [Brevinematia bacterium]
MGFFWTNALFVFRPVSFVVFFHRINYAPKHREVDIFETYA